jgi:cytochrome P450
MTDWQEAKAPPGPGTADDYEILKSRSENSLELIGALSEQYGDTVLCPNAYGQAYLFNHPKQVRHFLHSTNYERTQLLKIAIGESTLSSDGELWRKQRRVVTPAFQSARVLAFGQLMASETRATTERWTELGSNELDIDEEMMRLTLVIAVKALFSTDVSEHVLAISKALTSVITDLGTLTGTLFGAPAVFDPQRNRRMKSCLSQLNEIVYGLIAARREHPGEHDDLMNMLLTSRDPETGDALNDEQLRNEIVTMIVAGHETTATSLSWTWALLADNPAVEARFHKEVDQLEGRLPTSADLAGLKYTQGIFQESLRLYPPVWTIARRVKEDEVVDGYRIQGNSAAFICPYILHRHPDYWDNPNAFEPERHLEPRASKIERYAYVPFARGPHMCAGHHFATQEAVLLLATVAQKFRFRPVRDTPAELWPLVTLRIKDGLPMRLEPRG